MTGGEWTTAREQRRTREETREAKRRLTIEFADKLWLASSYPCDDAILAWLSEHRAEASKIGASRWNLETLPTLHEHQRRLRQAAAFQEVLERASISHQTLTAEAVLAAGGFPQIPQPEVVENKKRRAHAGKRQKRRKRAAPA